MRKVMQLLGTFSCMRSCGYLPGSSEETIQLRALSEVSTLKESGPLDSAAQNVVAGVTMDTTPDETPAASQALEASQAPTVSQASQTPATSQQPPNANTRRFVCNVCGFSTAWEKNC
eukprot:TRINITY_DN515_c0_g1_i12.p1 TRINITY_DN515_c0_g1~~TRINITY_DN515_c0_g1_i12.p1  ORF type:complete len:117 (-),score=13.79 TRINITY_DN515_c0_g1_i12:68-418(-)